MNLRLHEYTRNIWNILKDVRWVFFFFFFNLASSTFQSEKHEALLWMIPSKQIKITFDYMRTFSKNSHLKLLNWRWRFSPSSLLCESRVTTRSNCCPVLLNSNYIVFACLLNQNNRAWETASKDTSSTKGFIYINNKSKSIGQTVHQVFN